jgi:gamma-glutamylcyclotransferase
MRFQSRRKWEGNMLFFAYDDKMYTPLLEEILPDCVCIGQGVLVSYKLYFHRMSEKDHSGKCNIIKVNDLSQEVYGVLYELPCRDKHLLDKAEHLGFGAQEIALKVKLKSGEEVYASTFIANKSHILEDLVPYTWYKELVIEGARAHGLPKSYIHHLEGYASQNDPNLQREEAFRALLPPSRNNWQKAPE